MAIEKSKWSGGKKLPRAQMFRHFLPKLEQLSNIFIDIIKREIISFDGLYTAAYHQSPGVHLRFLDKIEIDAFVPQP